LWGDAWIDHIDFVDYWQIITVPDFHNILELVPQLPLRDIPS
jgi:hypothetical protein